MERARIRLVNIGDGYPTLRESLNLFAIVSEAVTLAGLRRMDGYGRAILDAMEV
jgi:hypothetical protein